MTTAPKSELSEISWPAIWLSEQADELIVIEHLADLFALTGEDCRLVGGDDRMVDSQLHQWRWHNNSWQPQASPITLAELTEYFHRHAALCNVCCIEKLAFPDFDTLITALKSID